MSDEIRMPPRFAEKILGLLCSDHGSRTALGDFAEVYAEMAAERGSAAAGIWYGGQILKSIPGFLLARFYWSAVMLRNYLVIFYRNLIRDRGISLINLAGLATGMACFLLILTYVRFETSYDGFHEKADRIYRVLSRSEAAISGWTTSTSDLLAPALTSQIPGVVQATLVYPAFGEVILEFGDRTFSQTGCFADGSFLDVFSFLVIRGDRRTALSKPSSIILTESAARKLFGSDDPLGKVIGRRSLGGRRELAVTAVMRDVPQNSHLKFEYLVSLETLRVGPSASNMFGSWDVAYFTTYVELAPGESRESVEALVPAVMSKVAGSDRDRSFMKFSLQPLRDIHLRSKGISEDTSAGDIRSVRLFLAIAGLILLIACVNHVNLATARSSVRAREIGIRKVNGACRAHIFRQFLGESFVIAAAAGGLALGLITLAVPRLHGLFGVYLRIRIFTFDGLGLWLAATVVFVGFCAGIYPALILSGLRPVVPLRDHAPSGKKGALLRNLLVVFQFSSAVILMSGTIVILSQMNYVRTERLGYDREHILVIPAREQETTRKLPALRAAFEERTEVVRAARSGSLPTRLGVRYSGVEMAKDDGTKVRLNFDIGYVDDHFLDVFKIDLAAGRDFRPGDKDVVLINETAVRDLGWKDPVGRKFLGGSKEVIGVVKDFHYGSLHNKIGPMALFYDPAGAQISVRIRPGDLEKTIGVLRYVFERHVRSQPFDFFFLDDAFNALYKKEMRTGKIFGGFAGLAILIACLGLLGLTSFNVTRRTKEIGVRKVLGATVTRLVLLPNRDFIRLVTIANLLAWPLAYVAMNKWLEDFAYRISIRPWIFLLSSLLSLAVAVLVVWGQTVRAARVNPADTLRYE